MSVDGNARSIIDVYSAESIPRYPHIHGGPCLVAGSAWNVESDIKRARELRPDAFLFGINRTPIHIKCDAMVAIDVGRAEEWKGKAEENFGPIKLHSGRSKCQAPGYDWIDYWWPELQGNGGTSVWMGCKIALAIGFDEVIVCGAPLSQGPYIGGEDDWTRRNENQLDAYRKPWAKDAFMHPYVKSMSGWTRELLGEPE